MRIVRFSNDEYTMVLLDHDDFVTILLGVSLSYRQAKWLRENGFAYLYRSFGGFNSGFEWDKNAIGSLNRLELINIYMKLKVIKGIESVEVIK